MRPSHRQLSESAQGPEESLFHRGSGSPSELTQIPRNLLFRYRFPCRRVEPIETQKIFELPESCSLAPINRLEGRPAYAQWRVAWNDEGLYFTSAVSDKHQSLWCRPNQILDSDSLMIWVDTRDTHNVHRATRYCHWFVILPTGPQGREPASCHMLRINRAREDSPTLNRGEAKVHAAIQKTSYRMACFLPANLLNGWSPAEQPNIGFFAAQFDREWGWQTLGTGPELPIAENPTLWATLDLCNLSRM